MYRISLSALIAVNTALLLWAPGRRHESEPLALAGSPFPASVAADAPQQGASPGVLAGSSHEDAPDEEDILEKAPHGDEPDLAGEAPASDVSPAETPADPPAPLVLMNSRSSGAAIGYLLDGEEYWLAPGERHEFERAAPREIVFHRGGELGVACHELESGVHRFVATPEGWELTPVAGETPQLLPGRQILGEVQQ